MNWRRGLLRLWFAFSVLWVAISMATVGGDIGKTWRRALTNNSVEAVIDRTLDWLPMFRQEPLTRGEREDALDAMKDGLSLLASAERASEDDASQLPKEEWQPPEEDRLESPGVDTDLPPGRVSDVWRIPSEALVPGEFVIPPLALLNEEQPSLIDSFDIGRPPKVLKFVFLDSSTLEIDFEGGSEVPKDLASVKARLRKALLEECRSRPDGCTQVQPTVAEALLTFGPVIGPPVGLLLVGVTVGWVLRGFRAAPTH